MYDTRWISGGYCKQIRSSAWLEHYTDNVGVSSSNLDGSTKTGGLAQLARASALHAEGHRFDSDILHHNRVGKLAGRKSSLDDLWRWKVEGVDARSVGSQPEHLTNAR
jgi:hypothetical protein